MKLIQIYDQDGEQAGLYNVSETHCPDDQLQTAFNEAFETEDPDEELYEKWGIVRCFVESEIYVK